MTPASPKGSFRCAVGCAQPAVRFCGNADGRDMYTFLLTLLVLDGVFLGVVILIQSGKGGGLAAMGGGAAATDVLGGRQATTLLTRATWIAGSAFMVLALVLAILSSRSAAPTSVLEGIATPPATAPQPLLPDASATPILVPPDEGAGEEQVPPAEGESGDTEVPPGESEQPAGAGT